MTLHHESVHLLRELLHELDAIPATRLLLKSNAKGADYYARGRAIVARAEDLRLIEDKRRLRDPVSALAQSHYRKNHILFVLLESIVKAKGACASIGDGDTLVSLDTAALVIEDWFKRHPDEKLPPPLPRGAAAGGPFAGSDDLFDLHTHTDPGDVGRRA